MDILKDISIAIGKRVKAIRKAQGMTQEQLGLLTNIDSADISKYESGKINLTLKTFSKFVVALKTQPKEFFDFEFDIKKYHIDE
ncbi:Helix-turn-helix domain-containing protein [Epilithonimonas bovis DSM 19482]|jgi:transcriptional regulator with XRE-family HTH domain|uniref:Helix-turn-helix domain-containing protein n=1 Tax=Epilithonimonas bovis DSM 19482 TaxID=1121284 RepID=A0A1U7PWM0_9FLAO|nr:helix-turn-helix transcriptional regulator [Epilithonimonas bovis]SIT96178.1 Helix-turn-helix domain-containing protein [Epilithonimonas bovis DSM 19482]